MNSPSVDKVLVAIDADALCNIYVSRRGRSNGAVEAVANRTVEVARVKILKVLQQRCVSLLGSACIASNTSTLGVVQCVRPVNHDDTLLADSWM